MNRAGIALALSLAFGAVAWGCGPRFSSLVVHNRTDAPIKFENLRGEVQFVAACTSETFRWNGAWVDESPIDPIPGAIDVRIDAAPPVDATTDFVQLVSSDRFYTVDDAASLPPCRGLPPIFLTMEVYNGTVVPVRFEGAGEMHYVEACERWRYDWTGDGWANALGPEAPIPGAIEVVVDVTPPPGENNHVSFVVIGLEGAAVVSENPYPGPTPCAGSPPPARP